MKGTGWREAIMNDGWSWSWRESLEKTEICLIFTLQNFSFCLDVKVFCLFQLNKNRSVLSHLEVDLKRKC